MKIIELVNNIQLPITNEEADLLTKFSDDNNLNKSDLSPRQQILANQLVNKNILLRTNQNGQIVYSKKIKK
jgi:hypothetical protein